MSKRRFLGGAVLLLVGLAFLMLNYGLLPSEFWKLWPLILVAAGAWLLVKKAGPDEKK
jgi:Domain of unknown function (DUF5668)